MLLKKLKQFYNFWYEKRRKDEMKKFINIVKGKRVLDLGSGIGIFNKVFRNLGFKEIFSVDNNERNLEINDANKKFLLNLENRLPFPNNYFDFCFASEIIEHLREREQFLKEIYRVLKKNGYLLLTTPNKDSLIAKFDKMIGRFVINGLWTGHSYEHRYVYGYDEIQEIIEKIGFRICKVETFYLFYGLPIKTKTSLGMCTWILARK